MSQFGGGGGREDCWSEGGTACLVDAWGDRYLQLNRGNLRQKDWSAVADAVNARQELLGRPRKTDVQCKNRIDTVKKKYKSEKSKAGVSQWPLFAKLDHFVGPTPSPGFKKPRSKLPALAYVVKPRNPNPDPGFGGGFDGGSTSGGSRLRSPLSLSSESSREENDDDDTEIEVEENGGGFGREKRKWDGLGRCEERGRGGELGQLARAIVKFAEVYERVEREKQKQMMELERHRMECAKDMEFQWMKMFMEAQVGMEKMKRAKHGSGSASPSLSLPFSQKDGAKQCFMKV